MGSPSESRPPRTASTSTPASKRAARVISPLMPLKQSKCRTRTQTPPSEYDSIAQPTKRPGRRHGQSPAPSPRFSHSRQLCSVLDRRTPREHKAGIAQEPLRPHYLHAVLPGLVQQLPDVLVHRLQCFLVARSADL